MIRWWNNFSMGLIKLYPQIDSRVAFFSVKKDELAIQLRKCFEYETFSLRTLVDIYEQNEAKRVQSVVPGAFHLANGIICAKSSRNMYIKDGNFHGLKCYYFGKHFVSSRRFKNFIRASQKICVVKFSKRNNPHRKASREREGNLDSRAYVIRLRFYSIR